MAWIIKNERRKLFFPRPAPTRIAADNWGWRTTAGKYHCKIKARYSPIIETDSDCRVVVGCTTLVNTTPGEGWIFQHNLPSSGANRGSFTAERWWGKKYYQSELISLHFCEGARGKETSFSFLLFFTGIGGKSGKCPGHFPAKVALNWKWRLKQFSVLFLLKSLFSN